MDVKHSLIVGDLNKRYVRDYLYSVLFQITRKGESIVIYDPDDLIYKNFNDYFREKKYEIDYADSDLETLRVRLNLNVNLNDKFVLFLNSDRTNGTWIEIIYQFLKENSVPIQFFITDLKGLGKIPDIDKVLCNAKKQSIGFHFIADSYASICTLYGKTKAMEICLNCD